SECRAVDHPTAVVSAASGSRLPLVGRVSECKALDRSIDGLMDQQPQRMWLLVGDIGIGKTRLLEYVVDGARAKGCLVLSARGFEAEMLRPYGCWIDAL